MAAFAGESGAGKTTAIVALIERFIAEGHSVGAIKHTHHVINDEDRGDTAKFRAAGASPVIFAGAGEAVVFEGTAKRRIRFDDPRELLAHCRSDIVFVEGFKSVDDWPRVELSRAHHRSLPELLEILDRIWRP